MIVRSIVFKTKTFPYLILRRNFYVPISHKFSNSFFTSYYANLIDHSFSLKSLVFVKSIHAHLIKLRLNNHTFLGNRLLDFYSKFGTIEDAFQVFDQLHIKNSFTWNILLVGFFKFGHVERGRCLFDEMPQRDVVSWNSMILGYVSNGNVGYALGVFSEMLCGGVKPSAFTFSIVMTCILGLRQGKEIHGSIIRSGLNSSNVVLCNCLIDMYGKFKLIDYAFGVFLTMEELDSISWNSLISGCHNSDYRELALDQFCLMRSAGYSPDEFTMSTVITICANLCVLEKGKQVFVLCLKMGFRSNSIVSSASIDMFSKCNRLDDSVRIFEEIYVWDSAICNSMISCYIMHGFQEEAQCLFLLSLRANVRPTEFTLSSVLTLTSLSILQNQGIQIHPLVLKLGFESYTVVASSLIDMYANSGLIDSAMEIFTKMGIKDLVSWNTMLMGLARNGRGSEALEIFEELLEQGVLPDRITLFGVLLACSHGGLWDEGRIIFSSMEEKYGISTRVEHFACLIDLMCRMGEFMEALEIIDTMPHEPTALILESLVHASKTPGDLKLIEGVAERVMKLEPRSYLPYYILVQVYGMESRWESVVRVRKTMKEKGVNKVSGCSWIGIKNQVFTFKANVITHYGEDIYSILRLLVWEMRNEGYQQYDNMFGYGGES